VEPVRKTIVIPYTPLAYQRALHDDPHRFRTVVAGRRVGKTTFAINELTKLAIKRRIRSRYWYVAPYYHQAKTIAWEMLLRYVPEELWAKKPNETELSLSLITGDKLELKGADNPASLEGTGLGALVTDEIQAIPKWRTLWQNTLRPMLSDYESPAIFIGRPAGFNHFHTLAKTGDHQGIIEGDWIEEGSRDPDFITYRFETEQNCREHNGGYIPHEEIEAARRQLTPEAFDQEYRARFTKYTGLVYKDFDRSVHVRELPDFRPVFYLRGLDRGFTNPTAVPIVGVDSDGVWYQTHELYAKGLTNPALSQTLNSLTETAGLVGGDSGRGESWDDCPFELCTMDSANAGDIAELNDLGHDFIPVSKETGESTQNYVRWKIQKFAERLRRQDNGQPRYYVHPRCVNTIREFETYAWPEHVDGKNPAENPLKLNDHMMDALADLNAMYMHAYEPEKRHPWDGKLPGTYIRPSVPEEEENDWNAPMTDYGSDEF
jgi:hypothetical protein